MLISDLPQLRLFNQGLAQPRFADPGAVVKWLGAVQSQDYPGGLWTIGMRMQNAVEADVEKAVSERAIVRTWPMRGTIHFVPAADTKWMVNLLAERVNKRMEYYYKRAELDEKIFAQCREITIQNLSGGKVLSRPEIYQLWEDAGISTKQTRGVFIIGHLAQEGLICFGPKAGKQPTFTLLDEWVAQPRKLEGVEAVAELALRYFSSHGPAEVKDFMWWTGLTLKEANAGIELIKAKLDRQEIDGKTYFAVQTELPAVSESPKAYLLQAYDEYTVAYKDHSVIGDPGSVEKVRKEIKFYSIVILDGRVVGFWKRTFAKSGLKFEFDFLRKLNKLEREAINQAAEVYGKFLGQTVLL
jgi:hypothetical protein